METKEDMIKEQEAYFKEYNGEELSNSDTKRKQELCPKCGNKAYCAGKLLDGRRLFYCKVCRWRDTEVRGGKKR